MFETRYTGVIEKGDLIVIAYDNYMILGIFAGRGKTGTVQYYSVLGLGDDEKSDPGGLTIRKYYKAYVNSPHETRITKLHYSFLDDKFQEYYWGALARLERSGIKF